MKINVKLNTQMEVRDFCYAAMELPRTISMRTADKDYDCKSILGMMSLNLSEPIGVEVSCSTDIDETTITNKFSQWIVSE